VKKVKKLGKDDKHRRYEFPQGTSQIQE